MKLGARDRAQLVIAAYDSGLVHQAKGLRRRSSAARGVPTFHLGDCCGASASDDPAPAPDRPPGQPSALSSFRIRLKSVLPL